MAFTAFTAERDSVDPEQCHLTWSYDGAPDSFRVYSLVNEHEENFPGTAQQGEYPFNRWLSGDIVIQEETSSDEATAMITAQPPALTAPQNVTATRDLSGLLSFAFDVPVWVSGMPEGGGNS